jgi:hypothetical protein
MSLPLLLAVATVNGFRASDLSHLQGVWLTRADFKNPF